MAGGIELFFRTSQFRQGRQPGNPSRPPLPERGSQISDETFEGAVGPHGALDVHRLHDVFGELDPAQRCTSAPITR